MDNIDWGYFDSWMARADYPTNGIFDPRTLRPVGELADRVVEIARTAPAMIEGGETFLDIGSNKGFWCFHLRWVYDRLVGYEPVEEFHRFSRELQRAHGIEDVEFILGGASDIPDETRFTCVYLGHVNHHLFNREVLEGREPFDHMRKFAALAIDTLVMDGPVTLEDPTARALSEFWSEDRRRMFTPENYIESVAKDFELVGRGPSGTTFKRSILCFRRKK